MSQEFSATLRTQEFLKELEDHLENPLHKRLIQAYQGDEPVQAMESELAGMLREVLGCED